MPATALWTLLAVAFTPLAFAESISGRVIEDHSGAALRGATVRILSEGQSNALAELTTNKDGHFELADLPAGDYRLEIAKPSYLSAILQVHAGAAASPVRLVRCGAISGHITGPPDRSLRVAYVVTMVAPEGGGPLRLFRPTEGRDSSSAIAEPDAHNQYRIYNLPPGRYAVALYYSTAGVGEGFRLYPNNRSPRFFTVSGGEDYADADFTVGHSGLFTVAGKVEAPASGLGLSVTLVDAEQPALALETQPAAASGAFHFRGVPPGSYSILASGSERQAARGPDSMPKPDHVQFFGRRSVVVGSNVDDMAIPVKEGPALTAALPAVKSGGPCPQTAGLAVRALEGWPSATSRNLELSAGKEQAVRSVVPGPVSLDVSRLGSQCYFLGPASVDLSDGQPGRVSLTIAPAATVTGHLTGVGNAQPGEFTIVLFAAGASNAIYSAVPDADFSFHFPSMRPGAYRIAARRARWIEEGAPATAFDLDGGSTTDISLPAPGVQQ